MENTKWWLDSTTIKSTLRAFVPTIVLIAGVFGLQIGEGELTKVIEAIAQIVSSVWVFVEFFNIIRGRFKADTPLRGKK